MSLLLVVVNYLRLQMAMMGMSVVEIEVIGRLLTCKALYLLLKCF